MKNKNIIIRIDEDKRVDFKVAMLRQHLSMQDIIEAFVDMFIAYDKGSKNPLVEACIKKLHNYDKLLLR